MAGDISIDVIMSSLPEWARGAFWPGSLALQRHQWDMADFSFCPYSKREIIEAGTLLAGEIAYDERSLPQVIETFRIAHSWRLANLYPMRRVRTELGGKIRSARADAVTAARLKRMVSVRKKLRAGPLNLYQMQDLGGCRAIISDQDQLNRLIARYEGGESAHKIVRDNDYIAWPRAETGYRSRHVVLKFSDPDGEEGFDRHFVEVQFRTRLQHYWATAVEAVGLVRSEDLKGGSGSADWLRLFQVMAGEMAEDEGTAPVPGVSVDSGERRKELLDLDARLRAVQSLSNYNLAIREIETFVGSASYYLIQYDPARGQVSVRPFRAANVGSDQYANAERDSTLNTVFVEVDRVADLRQAYPNYFLDVEAFTTRLQQALRQPDPPRPNGHAKKVGWFEDWKSWRKQRRA